MEYYRKVEDSLFPPPGDLEGHGHGISIAFLLVNEAGEEHPVTMVCIQLEPGGHVAPHTHYFEQVYFFLTGQLEVSVAGEVYNVTPHSYVIIPPHTVHSSRNIGEQTERHLEIMAGPWVPDLPYFTPVLD